MEVYLQRLIETSILVFWEPSKKHLQRVEQSKVVEYVPSMMIATRSPFQDFIRHQICKMFKKPLAFRAVPEQQSGPGKYALSR